VNEVNSWDPLTPVADAAYAALVDAGGAPSGRRSTRDGPGDL